MLKNKRNKSCKILSIALLILTASMRGHGGIEDYKNIIENPLYDVFYMYFNNERKEAVDLLKSLFDNPHYRTEACINYGYIMENENNRALAEKYYSKALDEKNMTAFIYLHNLYKKHDESKFLKMLDNTKAPGTDYWMDYERGLYYLKYNRIKTAYKYLKSAIKKGFSSTALLKNDPVFDGIRNSETYSRLMQMVHNNSLRRKSMLKDLLIEEYLENQNRPYGMIKELEIASYLEKTGKDREAKGILDSMIKSDISFRDKSTALFRVARIEAKLKNNSSARQYLDMFITHLKSDEKDETGYKKLVSKVYGDIIKNDKYLSALY